jgi:predicted outer membrane protein
MTPRFAPLAALALFLGAAGAVAAQAPSPSGLHDDLHLTPVQEAAWSRYQAAVAPDPGASARRQAAQGMMASLPTPRRIDLINAEMEADVATMRQQGEAVKAFYATLTPDQQHVFDRETLPRPGQDGGG